MATSAHSLRGKSLIDHLGSNFPSLWPDLLKVADSSVQLQVVDALFYLLEAAKEESPLSAFNLKTKLPAVSLVSFVIRLLSASESGSHQLIFKVCKIIEHMSDQKEFLICFLKNKGLETLLDILASNAHPQEITIQIFNYFRKGLSLSLFTSSQVLRRLHDQIIFTLG